MQKISILILGAARAGSTSLASLLASQKAINFSSEKEVHYFAFEDIFKKGEEYLSKYFDDTDKIKISADTYLLIDKKSQKRVKQYNPNMKFIIILRDPVLRAFSGYNYSLRTGYLKKGISFTESIEQEEKYLNSDDLIQRNNKCNILRSRYFANIKSWQEYFPAENFLLIKTSELKENPEKLLQKIFNFAGITAKAEIANIETKNQAFAVRSRFIQQIIVNRNNPIRLFIKKIVPRGTNKLLIKSGIIKKLDSLNKHEKSYKKITEDEYSYAYNILENDIKNLKNEFNINFSKE